MTASLPARKRQIAVAIEAARAVGLHVVGLDVRQDSVRVVTASEPLTAVETKAEADPFMQGIANARKAKKGARRAVA